MLKGVVHFDENNKRPKHINFNQDLNADFYRAIKLKSARYRAVSKLSLVI